MEHLAQLFGTKKTMINGEGGREPLRGLCTPRFKPWKRHPAGLPRMTADMLPPSKDKKMSSYKTASTYQA